MYLVATVLENNIIVLCHTLAKILVLREPDLPDRLRRSYFTNPPCIPDCWPSALHGLGGAQLGLAWPVGGCFSATDYTSCQTSTSCLFKWLRNFKVTAKCFGHANHCWKHLSSNVLKTQPCSIVLVVWCLIVYTRHKNFLPKLWQGCRDEKSIKARCHSEWNNNYSLPIPTFHTIYYSRITASLWNVGMGIEFQIIFVPFWITSDFCAFFIPTSLSLLFLSYDSTVYTIKTIDNNTSKSHL